MSKNYLYTFLINKENFMKFIRTQLVFLTLILGTSINSFAESLRCFEEHSFRTATMFINRDGAIGFNGTYINLEASWFMKTNFRSVEQLTGRKVDEKLAPSAVLLHLSPKGICTNNNDSLSEDFSCSMLNGEIDLVASEFVDIKDGSAVAFEKITKSLRLKSHVDLSAKIQVVTEEKRNIQLAATITNAKTGQQVKLSENMTCAVEK